MRGTRNYAEIVYAQILAKRLNYALHTCLDQIYLLVVGNDGVHMYGASDIMLRKELLFNIVNVVVRLKEIALSIDLRVEGCDSHSRAVGMYHKIVDTDYALIGERDRFYKLDDLLIRRCAENDILVFVEDLKSRYQNEHRYRKSDVRVGIYIECEPKNSGNKRSPRGKHVRKAVGACRLQNLGIYLDADAPVKKSKPELCENGYYKHRKDHRALAHWRRLKNFTERLAKQIKADKKDDNSHRH